ncbi:MAG: AMP-binding protein, partial [Acidobacteriota bacterium]|nr:AMP-binding protein [Acidobacteriota bacterium]
LGPNSSRWVAMNLAIMAEGAMAVPLYSRQAPDELVAMMKDCGVSLLCCAGPSEVEAIRSCWSDLPPVLDYSQVLDDATPDAGDASAIGAGEPPGQLQVVTIIYTSGTSGEPKGVMLNGDNIGFMLQRTTARLEELMQGIPGNGDDRVFHYLPLCFAGSWILLLTCLYRNNNLMLSTDLNRLADEWKLARPQYMLNVPALLERIRTGVEEKIRGAGGVGCLLFSRGQLAWLRQQENGSRPFDSVWLALARRLVFAKIRDRIGSGLRALICGSAPLAEETQQFFQMIGIPVLQVYGLTETTAICTMDDVHRVTAGRVGPAIRGIEMRLSEEGEILVRGPNIFPGYWNRPEADGEVFREGWFRTGDQGEVDATGNWKIVGRMKNIIITTGGHNISPEPIEQSLLEALPTSTQVMVVGNGRKYLSALLTGPVSREESARVIEEVNRQLPHYRRIRRFHIAAEPFSIENGLLAANGKQRRTAIESHFRDEIEALYQSD